MNATSTIKSYRDLIAWKKAFAICMTIMRATKQLPPEERFGLASQLRRSAISVPSNIAEGFGRGSRPDYLRSLYIARGSLFELSTQIQIAHEMGYVDETFGLQITENLDECERVLCGLIRALESKPASAH